MAIQNLRSSSAHKRPIAEVLSAGQIAINTNQASPGLFFKDSNGDLVKVGPVHIGTSAPNSSPATTAADALVSGTVYQILTLGTTDFTAVGASANTVGVVFTATGAGTGTGTVSGQQGNEKGEQWLDTTGGTYVLKIYDGSAWRSESGTFVDVNGDTMTGDLVMNNANIVFEGATADDFETTLTVTDPTADRTITLPNVTGTVVTTGDTGSVTSTMIADGAIVNADINASAAIAGTKIDPDFGSQTIETTGVFSAADGAAGTPSITFTGDTNTGIYRPGADQVAISTNGTAAVTVDASQRVGIGTASPATKLEITHGNELGLLTSGPYNFQAKFESTDSEAAIIIEDSNSTNDGNRIGVIGDNMAFTTANSERLRITSDGKVGVGTSSPGCLLELAKAGANGAQIDLKTTDNTTATSRIRGLGSDGFSDGEIRFADNGINFQTGAGGAAQRVRIDAAGNVGVGTTSPTAKLDIEGSSAGEIGLHINNTSGPTSILTSTGGSYSFAGVGANTSWLLTSGDTLAIGPYSANGIIKFVTNSAERMRIDSSGNVGIGTTSPMQDLQVGDFSGSNGIAIAASPANYSFIYFADGNSGTEQYRGYFQYSHADDALEIATAGTERMRVDSSGRLLVGTSSSPSSGNGQYAHLAVQGSTFDSTGAGIFNLQSGKAATSLGSTEDIGFLQFTDNAGNEFAWIRGIVNGSPGDSDYPGALVFSTTADSASSPTERMRINSAGKVLIGKTNVAAGSTSGLEMIGSANDTNYTFAVYDATGSDRVISVRNDNNLVSTTAYGRTTSSGANMNIDSAGFIRRSTSSAKYKTNVETIEDSYSQAILDCRPVWYRSISDGDNPQWGWWGFIAEEVAEIDPRLVQWKTTKTERNENNEIVDIVLDNPEPEGVQYDRFVPHLLNLIKRQKEQIEAMEARLSALEAS